MSRTKRALLTFSVLFVVFTATLAFIPHYSCACGEIKKQDGSLLTWILSDPIREIGKIIEKILR